MVGLRLLRSLVTLQPNPDTISEIDHLACRYRSMVLTVFGGASKRAGVSDRGGGGK